MPKPAHYDFYDSRRSNHGRSRCICISFPIAFLPENAEEKRGEELTTFLRERCWSVMFFFGGRGSGGVNSITGRGIIHIFGAAKDGNIYRSLSTAILSFSFFFFFFSSCSIRPPTLLNLDLTQEIKTSRLPLPPFFHHLHHQPPTTTIITIHPLTNPPIQPNKRNLQSSPRPPPAFRMDTASTHRRFRGFLVGNRVSAGWLRSLGTLCVPTYRGASALYRYM